jgi:hypothetical protein
MASGDTWIVVIATGKVLHVTNGVEATFWEASGQGKAFPTQAAAQAFASESLADRLGGDITGPASQAASDVGKDVFKGLNLGNIILRGAEIMLGITLIAVGIAKLTGATNIIEQTAKEAGKAVVAT